MADIGISVGIIADDSGARVIQRSLNNVCPKQLKTAQGEIGHLGTSQKGLNAILNEAVTPLERLRSKQAEYNLYLKAGILDQENYAIVTQKKKPDGYQCSLTLKTTTLKQNIGPGKRAVPCLFRRSGCR